MLAQPVLPAPSIDSLSLCSLSACSSSEVSLKSSSCRSSSDDCWSSLSSETSAAIAVSRKWTQIFVFSNQSTVLVYWTQTTYHSALWFGVKPSFWLFITTKSHFWNRNVLLSTTNARVRSVYCTQTRLCLTVRRCTTVTREWRRHDVFIHLSKMFGYLFLLLICLRLACGYAFVWSFIELTEANEQWQKLKIRLQLWQSGMEMTVYLVV